MKFSKLAAIALAALSIFSIACGPSTKASNGEITVCVGPIVRTLDPALNASVDGSIYLTNAFAGLYSYKQEGSKLVIQPECAKEIAKPTQTADGKYQYVITLKEGLKWSDGEEMKASDFEYAWKRAADPQTEADYQYMFDIIDGYSETTPALNVTADDAARTLTVVTTAFCAYFDQLMAFPTYYPVRKDIIDANLETWATKVDTYISNGPFKLQDWDIVGNQLVFVKNDNYWDAKNVKLNKIIFAMSDQVDAIFAAFEEGTYSYANNPPVSQIGTLKTTRLNKDFFIGDYIGTYFLPFNVNVSFKPGQTTAGTDEAAWAGWTPLQNAKAKRALSLLIDRTYITDQVLQGGQKPADGFVPAGMSDGAGTEFRSKAAKWWDPTAVVANREEAVGILHELGYAYDEATKTFTNFPTWVYATNGNANNVAIAESIQNMWKEYGISVQIEKKDWAVFQTALTNGDFQSARMGWIADYDDPIGYLDIFSTSSGNNHEQLGRSGIIGKGNSFGPNADQSWQDFYQADLTAIKSENDLAKRAELMYTAEAKLKDLNPIMPLYYYTNPYLKKENLVGVVTSPLGWVSFKEAYVK